MSIVLWTIKLGSDYKLTDNLNWYYPGSKVYLGNFRDIYFSVVS